MADEELEQYLDYFDQQSVEIRFIEALGQSPVAVWYGEFHRDEAEKVERDDLVLQLEESLTAEGPPPDHTLDVTRRYHDWGASAAVQEIVLQVGSFVLEQGREFGGELIRNGASAGLYYLWHRWRSRRNGAGESLLDRESAEMKARERLANIYSIAGPELQLRAESHDADKQEWSCEFTHQDVQYSASVRDNGPRMLTVELGRRLDPR